MDEGGICRGDAASSLASQSKLGSSRADVEAEFSRIEEFSRSKKLPVSTLLKDKYVFKKQVS